MCQRENAFFVTRGRATFRDGLTCICFLIRSARKLFVSLFGAFL